MERIADGLAHLEAGSPQSTTPTSSFLHDLYYGDYEPSVFKKQSSEQKKMDKSVSAAEAVLRNILQKSPSAIKAFEAYQIAVGEQHGAVTEQAFESGFRLPFRCYWLVFRYLKARMMTSFLSLCRNSEK